MKAAWLSLGLLLAVVTAAAGDRVAKAAFVADQSPKIDGAVDEPIWQKADPLTDFKQETPNNGQPASERTEVRFLYSRDILFVGVVAFDSEPEKISRRLQRRDTDFNSDWTVIYLDPNLDRRTGYAFRISSAGVEVDSILYDDTRGDSSWDAVWDSAVSRFDGGWSAELAIPFSQLRLPARGAAAAWGVNIERALDRKSEIAFWVHNDYEQTGRVSRFGLLEGIRDIRTDKRLEVTPYALVSSTSGPDQSGEEFEVGADLTYRLSPAFNLDATVNPDFGQVEADPSVLNLTVFETFFPEKRAFFLEGAEIFQTRFNQFFSRRIGRRPGHFRYGDARVVSRPENTQILGAAKVTGRTRGGSTLGLLVASTDEEKAEFELADGRRERRVLEPQTQYLVARAKQDILQGSGYIGGQATGVLRDNSFNAYTAAVDWELYFNQRKWITRGNLIGSETGPDGARDRGWGADLSLDSTSYKHWDFEVDLDFFNEELNLNDTGFLSRNDIGEFSAGVSYNEPDPHGVFLRRTHQLYVGYEWNSDGFNLSRRVIFDNFFNFRNNWRFELTYFQFFTSYDDRETRGGPLTRQPGGKWAEFELYSDRSKRWSFGMEYRYEWIDDGGLESSLEFETTYFPTPPLQLSAAVEWEREKDDSQWVANAPDDVDPSLTRYIFGRLDSEVLDLTLRMNWTFTPEMSLQVYTQPFLAAGKYGDFRELAQAGTDRYTPFAWDRDEDFNIAEFTLNAVFRWEYMPGSQLFVIWNEGRSYFDRDGELRPGDNFEELFDAAATDTFVIKASLWINR